MMSWYLTALPSHIHLFCWVKLLLLASVPSQSLSLPLYLSFLQAVMVAHFTTEEWNMTARSDTHNYCLRRPNISHRKPVDGSMRSLQRHYYSLPSILIWALLNVSTISHQRVRRSDFHEWGVCSLNYCTNIIEVLYDKFRTLNSITV